MCSEGFVKRHNLESQAVEIIAMDMATDLPSTFNEESCMKMVRILIYMYIIFYAHVACMCILL